MRFSQVLAPGRFAALRTVGGWSVVWVAVVTVIFMVGFGPPVIAAPAPECTGSRALDARCLVERYETLTRGAGAQAALADLVEQRKTNSYLDLGCHQIVHVVGRTASQRLGPAAFRDGSDLCASGYYHGVTEGVMMAIGPDQILDRAEEVCAEFRRDGGFSYLHYNCIHGTGHGFMAVFANDIFQSLAGCDRLAETWEQQHCYSGVFMENLSSMDDPERPSTALRPEEPLYPCTAVDDRYKAECYVKQTAYALYIGSGDFGAVFALCLEEPRPEFRAACHQGVGGDATITSSKYVIGAAAQAATTRQLCLLGPDAGARANCVIGAVITIVRDLAGDDTKARTLCAALADQALATVCEETRIAASQGVPVTGGPHRHER